MATQRIHEEDSFENETFADLNLQETDLGGKEFYRCTFLNCTLQESRWTRTRMESCVFTGCDLTRARFTETSLRDVRFESSKLMGIDWTDVGTFPEVTFDGSNLRYCTFAGLSLRKTAFLRCTALEMNFIDTDLSEADFSDSDITGSNFRGCTLTKADFGTAQGVFIDPARNRVKATRIPVEAAVNFVQTLGLVVSGYGEVPKAKTERKKGRS
ncbi:pentapeptide repeat domain protein [Myxococcus xanthus DK 1622]|uniref:Pentapeptide repeat domain protein n=1 Tax=Myxococcus xanthus (strain DK1622) TaxID=246197 RepID=Q1D649_MYXXD|nr:MULTISPECIES: pentapeptide repeat-containing protein [Myxococcus]ABF86515.1 pentapeptide repeat domain protein [Myxococcus xanthus DK 1622]NOJ52299.1 pentapeptide repeat-containing protein [Myxococcus xanthus]QPM83082.1 pentapeptide repeat-containing protein [Myxococcus xanthus]QVW65388.1 pentapeptide repeat-containing protein [Myxococcus xanthus DZ2]QZZ51380.1 Pentapeptide repeat protein MfpA [Myxococcus xanthus]